MVNKSQRKIESEWITDRRPTMEDADALGEVWASHGDCVLYHTWSFVKEGTPWQPTYRPEPYVEPKRFRVEYFEYDEEKESGRFSPGCYIMVTDFIDDDIIYNKTPLPYLTNRDAHKEAAERIAAIYEEVMP